MSNTHRLIGVRALRILFGLQSLELFGSKLDRSSDQFGLAVRLVCPNERARGELGMHSQNINNGRPN